MIDRVRKEGEALVLYEMGIYCLQSKVDWQWQIEWGKRGET